MFQLPTSTAERSGIFGAVLAAALVCALAVPASAGTREKDARTGASVCAVVESSQGAAVILDASRTTVSDLAVRQAVGCGAWISVKNGPVVLRHRDGHRLTLGPDSYVSVPQEGDEVLLYHGQVHVATAPGGPQLRVLTANARGRIRGATAVVIYSEEREESQLIALAGTSSLENRFVTASAPKAQMKVRAGEASSLNMKVLRVVPSAPRPLSAAALKTVLAGFQLESPIRETAHRNLEKRHNRKIASFPVLMGERQVAPEDLTPEERAEREKTREEKQSRYMRHQPDNTDQRLKGHWVGKFTGGTALGNRLIESDRRKGRRLGSENAESGPRRTVGGSIIATTIDGTSESEKQKLIDELKNLD